jgi:hypothetical protein
MLRSLLNRIRERWYFIVRRYFTYLDTNRIARHNAQYEYDLKAQAVVANIAGEKICVDSGMCAAKGWRDRPGANKAPELYAKFESTTRERHDAVTGILMDLSGKPVPPPIEGVTSVLNVDKS